VSSLLEDAGQALYGPQWQSAMARDLGVSDRTVRRWAAGSSVAPASAYLELERIAQRRAGELRELAPRLEGAARDVDR
jgi:DNA-binding transcriptional regulator YdaS (Cro superfamily)